MLDHHIVTVCTSSTGEYLAGPQDLKDALNTTTTAYDDQMANLMKDVTEIFSDYVGFPLLQQTYLETVPSYGDHTLQVRSRIAAITQIDYDGAIVQSTEYQIVDPDVTGLIYREYGWPHEAGLISDLTNRIEPNSERPVFNVEYVGGYTFSTCAGASWTLPRPIHRKAIEYGVSLWQSRSRNRFISSKQVGDLRISYSGGEMGGEALPKEITCILDDYRRYR